jgi:NAD(P)-dependent dehydrogenase (short-subunit alcohol dehydrogenase family)
MRDRGLDRLLDRSIVPGYTKLGFALRRRSWPADDPSPDALAGKRALVTGAGGGLGEATALGLARLGATVHLLVRSAGRAQPALERIERSLTGRPALLQVEECDVSDLSAVREFADRFVLRLAERGESLDVLVHNAGVMPDERTLSTDGHELTLATHVLGPVLMTERLLPLLSASPGGARTIFVSSGGQYTQSLPADDLQFERGEYRGTVAYARSKRVQVELAPVLARRWAGHGVSVFVTHPGWADTPGVADALPGFRALTRPLLRAAEAGADTVVWLAATEPCPASGAIWHDRRQRPTSYLQRTRPSVTDIDRVWQQVRGLSGVDAS